MMTRNDFELLAVALKSTHSCIISQAPIRKDAATVETRLQGFNEAVNAVAEVCKANNSRFDKKRFMKACGLN